MMDNVTLVAVVQDGNGVNACAVFGDFVFVKESLKLSLGAADKRIAETLRKNGSVRLMEPQYVLDGFVMQSSNSVLTLPLSDFIADDMTEYKLGEVWRPFRRMMFKLRKEFSLDIKRDRDDPELLAALRAELDELAKVVTHE